MFFKKSVKSLIPIVLCMAFLVGCGSGFNTSGSTVVTGGPDDKEVVLTYEGTSLNVRDFRYYVYVEAMKKAYSIDPAVSENPVEFDWDQKDESGKPISDEIISNAIESALRDSVLIDQAEKHGSAMSEEEIKSNNQAIESTRIQNGDEAFLLSANALGISDIEGYKNVANRMSAVEFAKKAISENMEEFIEPDLDLTKWKSDEMVTAQHVLITNESEKYTDPEATAQEVLAKAKAGEDFAALIEQYNEDPGATAAGYTFGPGEMVPEFEKAAFALECDEISDVVKTEYGYHIIHRVAGLAELQNYWVQNVKYQVEEDVVAEISVKEIMEAAGRAQIVLQGMSNAQENAAG